MSYYPYGGLDYYSRAARGLVTGASAVRKFGRNANTGTSFEPVWLHSGGLTLFGAAGSTLTISSSSGNDTSAGTGARTITVVGVDESWAAQTEVITMNGTSNVTSSLIWGWVNSVTVTTIGTIAARANIGTITGITTTGSYPAFIIAAGQGQTQQACYAVEDGKNLEVYRVRLGSEASKPADFQFGLDLDPMNATAPIVSRRYIGNVDGVVGFEAFDLLPPTIVPGGSLLWVESKLGAGTGSVTAAFDAILF